LIAILRAAFLFTTLEAMLCSSVPGNEEKSFAQKITKVTKTILSIETAYARSHV
jgi:hypothetical protein